MSRAATSDCGIQPRKKATSSGPNREERRGRSKRDRGALARRGVRRRVGPGHNYIGTACLAMAYVVMAYIVMEYADELGRAITIFVRPV